MRKSNFLKKTFSSVGTSSPHFQKIKAVTLYIAVMLLLLGSSIIMGSGFVVALASPDVDTVIESPVVVTASAPDNTEINNQLTSINYHLESMESNMETYNVEMQETNIKLDTVVGLLAYVIGAMVMLIVIVMFIAFYNLFNRFFRF